MTDDERPSQGGPLHEDLTASPWLRSAGESPILCERATIGMAVWRRVGANAGRKAWPLLRHGAMQHLNGQSRGGVGSGDAAAQWLPAAGIR